MTSSSCRAAFTSRRAQTWAGDVFRAGAYLSRHRDAAYDFTVSYLRGEVPGEPPVKRRMYPTRPQVAGAQMRIQLETMKAAFVRAIQEAAPNPSQDVRMRLYAAQYAAMEGATTFAAWRSAPEAGRA